MTKEPPGMVALITYERLCTFEFGIAIEVFGLPRPEFDFPWYEFVVVASENRRVQATGGISIDADYDLCALARAKTIVIPGWRDVFERPPEKLLNAIRVAYRKGARIISICSGSFVLAAAGLLDGKQATTHWRYVSQLKECYPKIRVEENVLYVDEDNIITSAGSAAGIDACMHLVRRDFGNKVANTVSRRLVTPPHRDGGQAQFIHSPIQETPKQSVGLSMDWARKRISNPTSLGDMARCVNMSERTFIRRFNSATGTTPMKWLQRERMFNAQELLESSDRSLINIANCCGYKSLETFRVTFKRVVGTSPAAYRSHFRHL